MYGSAARAPGSGPLRTPARRGASATYGNGATGDNTAEAARAGPRVCGAIRASGGL
ncbi:hypothetical protein [Streptomyces sp. NPDC002611]